MATAPPLTTPREGDRITDMEDLSYVKARSAAHQADMWNRVLNDDPVFGPASGFVVGVGPRMDGRYPLVWLRAPASHQSDDLKRCTDLGGRR